MARIVAAAAFALWAAGATRLKTAQQPPKPQSMQAMQVVSEARQSQLRKVPKKTLMSPAKAKKRKDNRRAKRTLQVHGVRTAPGALTDHLGLAEMVAGHASEQAGSASAKHSREAADRAAQQARGQESRPSEFGEGWADNALQNLEESRPSKPGPIWARNGGENLEAWNWKRIEEMEEQEWKRQVEMQELQDLSQGQAQARTEDEEVKQFVEQFGWVKEVNEDFAREWVKAFHSKEFPNIAATLYLTCGQNFEQAQEKWDLISPQLEEARRKAAGFASASVRAD